MTEDIFVCSLQHFLQLKIQLTLLFLLSFDVNNSHYLLQKDPSPENRLVLAPHGKMVWVKGHRTAVFFIFSSRLKARHVAVIQRSSENNDSLSGSGRCCKLAVCEWGSGWVLNLWMICKFLIQQKCKFL